MFHMMAFNAFQQDRLLPFMFDQDGKFTYEVLTPNLVSKCEGFDMSYFDTLPFAHISEEEIEQMKQELAWRYGHIAERPQIRLFRFMCFY